MVMRDIELVRATGAAMHFLHLSTARSVDLVVAARAQGLRVTFEIAPHHFTLDEQCCEGFDPAFKVHPPLRTKDDVAALVGALRRGDVNAVATDHAPHAPELKDLPFDEAPAGMLGLEHAASLTYEALGGAQCDPAVFFHVLSRGPSAIAQLRREDAPPRHSAHGGAVVAGEDANLTVFSPSTRWSVDRSTLTSRSMNTPYDGRELLGRVRATIAKGRLVVDRGVLT
jgi:dihydroorotase